MADTDDDTTVCVSWYITWWSLPSGRRMSSGLTLFTWRDVIMPVRHIMTTAFRTPYIFAFTLQQSLTLQHRLTRRHWTQTTYVRRLTLNNDGLIVAINYRNQRVYNRWPLMTLNGVMTSDACYLCDSWASCLLFFSVTWTLTFLSQITSSITLLVASNARSIEMSIKVLKRKVCYCTFLYYTGPRSGGYIDPIPPPLVPPVFIIVFSFSV